MFSEVTSMTMYTEYPGLGASLQAGPLPVPLLTHTDEPDPPVSLNLNILGRKHYKSEYSILILKITI